MTDLTYLRKVAEAYTFGPSAAAEATRVAFEEAFDKRTVKALLDCAVALEEMVSEAKHRLCRPPTLMTAKTALARLEKEAGR
jgi:hypothetical protein